MGHVKESPVYLAEAQKELLRTLVHFTQKGKIPNHIIPIPATSLPTYYVIHIQGEPSLKVERISDLDLLCDAGLLTFHWNRFGNGKFYQITKAGFRAIRENFFQTGGFINEDKALIQDYEQLAQDVRRMLPQILHGQDLADALREWKEVLEQVEQSRPDNRYIHARLRTLGRRLLSGLEHHNASSVAKAIILFGHWVEVIDKLN